MTEEEQRYAETWKEMRLRGILLLGGMGLGVLMFALAYGADELGFTSVAKAGIWLAVLCSFGAVLVPLFVSTNWVFRCPRCGARGAFDEERECYRCKLPIYAPRNPDPNWKA
jgi:hypothetical protein